MAIHTPTIWQKIQRYLQAFDFEKLFVDVLGWDYLREPPLAISFENQSFLLHPLVEKRGVKVYVCHSDPQSNIPGDTTLRKIEREATKHAYEHLIIYVDRGKTSQIWQWVKREQGKSSATRLHRYYKGQSGEGLAQKLETLAIAIDEEERLHTAEVAGKMARAFDVERVTKRFYDRFKFEHATFLQFISSITAQGDHEWYASLMLNRLMFIYFIQRKGFLDTHSFHTLDGDTNYLAHRLESVRQIQQGQQQENQFQTFYRSFLLKLFHNGLSRRENERSPELQALLGNIPYLNGSLFDVHTLESTYPGIDIPDAAFERLFAFFNEFDWHLDNRLLRNDKEINPDVLGYIFEQYINQKQMGAYYTKEDITGYISQNTIIPFIFDITAQKDLVAFQPDGSIWSLLREDPDKYIYDAVKKGCHKPLPPEIEAGVHDMARRGEWNKTATEEYALPTEIWREVAARRAPYEEVRAKLAAGEIHSINDLITYNLDICKFAGDVITYCEGPNLLLAFYHAIASVTVLDPTCGSGAFLFAALNILEPLYEACLDRMQNLVDECDQLNASIPLAQRRRYPAIEQFRVILNEVEQHPSRTYFIYKSIIINNLYGVDIMKEATEICKLRLFLKLVSQVEKFDDIEPLPDIDFNIRPGNTLVGFASHEETRKALQGRTVGKGTARESSAYQDQMVFDDRMDRIEQKAQEIERAFDNFRRIQTEFGQDTQDMAANKQHIRQMLKELGAELDGYLASEYGIDRNNMIQKDVYDERLKQWQESHQPFHWWIEFYSIMKKGGFDVIIGNPPYVASSKVKEMYQIKTYLTSSCGNLYAFVMERSLSLSLLSGHLGMIVPVSSISGESYKPLIEIFLNRTSWISSYSNRPAKLFAGVEQRLAIFIVKNRADHCLFASPYQHWYESEREGLFHRLSYTRASLWSYNGVPIKSGMIEAETVFKRLNKYETPLSSYVKAGQFGAWIHDGPTYWVRALPFEPNAGMKSERSNHYHRIPAGSHKDALVLASVLNSSTFYFFFKMVSNCRDLGQKEWSAFPFGKPTPDIITALADVGRSLEARLQITAAKSTRHYPSGTIEYEEYYPSKAKPIIDEIDRVLARHYGFTNEELDFIINYDIKYRMGRDSGDESEE